MWFIGWLLTPCLFVLCTGLLVEQRRRPLVPAVVRETFLVVDHCPVRRFVLDEVAILQPRECRTDRTFVDAKLGGDLAGFERAICVGREEAKYLVGNGEPLKLVYARVLEGFPVDGQWSALVGRGLVGVLAMISVKTS